MSDKTTGGRIMAEMLQAEGVSHLFGIIDGTYLMFMAGCTELGMQIITPRHEATAMHAAGAYARLSGTLGVAMASNGPGVANVLSAVAVEQAEGNRVLLLTSSRRPQISHPDRGGAYQCFDQTAVIAAMCKWSETVKSADRLPELMHKALRACYQGRPGVVHLDVPETIINGKLDQPSGVLAPHEYRRTSTMQPGQEDMARVVELVAASKLPVLHVGSGVIHAGAHEELAELSNLLHAPVTTSWSARGVLAETHPLVFPIVHIEAVNAVRNQADLILCLGSDLGETDWWGRPPNWRAPSEQTFVQVDIDESILGRNHRTDVAVLADIKAFMSALIHALKDDQRSHGVNEARFRAVGKLQEMRERHRRELDAKLADQSAPMLTGHVAASCCEAFPEDAIVVMDGGNTAVWGNFYTSLRRPNSQLGTHHFGHLGAGLGQAIGAAVAHPDRKVYCIIGDGAIGFHLQDIETAVRHGLDIVFLVCCDKQWGMVKLTERIGLDPIRTVLKKALGPEGEPVALPWKVGPLDGLAQTALKPLKQVLAKPLSADRTINADLHETCYDKVAEAMGALGMRVDQVSELRAALAQVTQQNHCAVIHVDVDPEKHLWAPGLMHFKSMHQEPGEG